MLSYASMQIQIKWSVRIGQIRNAAGKALFFFENTLQQELGYSLFNYFKKHSPKADTQPESLSLKRKTKKNSIESKTS